MSEVLYILKKTRATLIRSGWCQGALDTEGRHCLVEAMPVPTNRDVVQLLEKRVGVHRLSAWNDAPGRTAEEVIALLDAAIREEEG